MTRHFDSDLVSVQQARDLVTAAKEAMRSFQYTAQTDVDRICRAMVDAAMKNAARLGQMAHDETGFGFAEHKRLKNEFAAQGCWDAIKDVQTCGVLRHDTAKRIIEVGYPVGVVAALAPSTNPTSTAIFKILISVKARDGIVIAPHPTAIRSTSEAVRVMVEAGEAAGMPHGLVSCMTEISLAGTNELMRHPEVSLILATGGPGMVTAAHSCGKPAIGVGPGNNPCYVDRSADVRRAAEMIVESKSFDCSTICATEQSVLADAPIAEELKACMQAAGAYWLSAEQAEAVTAGMFRSNGLMHAKFVGRTPQQIAGQVGIEVPSDARILVAPLTEIGKQHPISQEKLTTLLGFTTVDGWREGCEKASELLKFGAGHSVSVHATDEEVVMAFALQKPAFRMMVNTWGSLGAVGFTTGLTPSFTLAPGGVGGAVISDNVSVEHLFNVKRIAYHLNDAPAAARAYGGRVDGELPGLSAGFDVSSIDDIVSRVLRELARQ
ncbi:aldehyde dehydrogenase family protein [Propionibacterium australiense]|uniref:Aldehyde dehydrogenase N-terminal domain n=1 Tax=Propionibacterium australiense TaxID=119981 RepID=A0A383S7A4_9ACTN|nr:aldehyde dehydrogenase family protein [Propionibacterium australiense]RLP10936.1 aldehyde dehydrogenase family protein [Propionibacterium australiense]RLP13097.1 aldehyde dehydrogenase family protein [Propionibacterium australiense]SYZ33890.1 Aldehyde dehydrogenase N-terminal domain [Propionibacterium australiense]VEH90890.1 Aldehyde-alcohol dehydrogenase [Propionibacterium australiense]